VVAWLERVGRHNIATTVISLAEVQCGIERQRVHHPATSVTLQAWLDSLLLSGGPHIHVLCIPSALLFARMIETPALRHFTLSDPRQKTIKTGADLAIAAIAITHGATIATGNTAHFAQISRHFPLPGLLNPFQP
jgi:predicted nucleic acid-binding protein